MHRFRIFFCTILIALALSACGKRLTIQDAREAGAPELSGGEVSRLISGSTLHFVSWDKADEADIVFFADGSLEGQNR